MTDATTNLVIN